MCPKIKIDHLNKFSRLKGAPWLFICTAREQKHDRHLNICKMEK